MQNKGNNFISIDMPKVDTFPKPAGKTLCYVAYQEEKVTVGRGVVYSLFAGLSAAGASVFGKLGMDTSYV